MDLEPEAVKVILGRKRYQALLGGISQLSMAMDEAEALIKEYAPPPGQYQVPTVEDMRASIKEARDALGAVNKKVRSKEVDLIASKWDF